MTGASEALTIFVCASSGDICVTINILQDLVDVLLLHMCPAHAKGVAGRSVLMVVDGLAHGLAHPASEVRSVVIRPKGSPIFDIRVANTSVAKAL